MHCNAISLLNQAMIDSKYLSIQAGGMEGCKAPIIIKSILDARMISIHTTHQATLME